MAREAILTSQAPEKDDDRDGRVDVDGGEDRRPHGGFHVNGGQRAIGLAPEVVEGHDVRVFQAGDGLRFRFEAADEIGVVGVAGADDLDHHLTADHRLVGAVHHAESTGADLGAVLAENFGLAVVPGSYFSDYGSRWIRFSYALPPEVTKSATERLWEGLSSL